jgi:hypothetical protein
MRHLLLFSILLLGTCWAVAQNSGGAQSGQSQSDPSYSNPAGSSQSDSTATSQGNAGTKQTIEGCLSGSGGNYTLTGKDGTTYQLAGGDTSKLSQHVGHEIKVTGTMSSSAAASGGGMASNAGQQTIEVSSFRHVSKTCTGGGGMSH